jgi:uncharacterized protein
MYPDLPQSARQWGMWCHLSGLVCAICNLVVVPFLSIIVPYLVWRSGRDHHPFVDDQGREAINFQLSMAIYTIVYLVLLIFLVFVTCGIALSTQSLSNIFGTALGILAIVGGLVFAGFAIFQLAVIILAALKAANGQSYQYPFTLRFLQ